MKTRPAISKEQPTTSNKRPNIEEGPITNGLGSNKNGFR
jgi:hypothetical protein